MKILALADVHRSETVLYKVREWVEVYRPDVIAVAGDITHFGPPEWAEGFVRALVDMGPHVVGVPGNCDPPEVDIAIQKGGGISVHDKRTELCGLIFAGAGGSNPTPFPTLYQRDEEEYKMALEGLMHDVDVFISHAPPMGKNDIASFVGGHVGSKVLAEILEHYRPSVVITGHIHEARGIIEENGITYINPGKAAGGNGGLVEITGGGRARAVLL